MVERDRNFAEIGRLARERRKQQNVNGMHQSDQLRVGQAEQPPGQERDQRPDFAGILEQRLRRSRMRPSPQTERPQGPRAPVRHQVPMVSERRQSIPPETKREKRIRKKNRLKEGIFAKGKVALISAGLALSAPLLGVVDATVNNAQITEPIVETVLPAEGPDFSGDGGSITSAETDNPLRLLAGDLPAIITNYRQERAAEDPAFAARITPELMQESSIINIAVIGTDYSGTTDSLEHNPTPRVRADAIKVVSMNLETGQVSVVTLPRDLYSPDNVQTRNVFNINGMVRYNPDQTVDTEYIQQVLESTTGLPIDMVFGIQMGTLPEIIDKLFPNGFEIEVPYEINDEHTGWYFQAGVQRVNGEQALQLMRSRYDSSDQARSSMQTVIIEALVKEFARQIAPDRDRLALMQGVLSKDLPETISERLSQVASVIRQGEQEGAFFTDGALAPDQMIESVAAYTQDDLNSFKLILNLLLDRDSMPDPTIVPVDIEQHLELGHLPSSPYTYMPRGTAHSIDQTGGFTDPNAVFDQFGNSIPYYQTVRDEVRQVVLGSSQP